MIMIDLESVLKEITETYKPKASIPDIVALIIDGQIIYVPADMVSILVDMKNRGFRTWAYQILQVLNPKASSENLFKFLELLEKEVLPDFERIQEELKKERIRQCH